MLGVLLLISCLILGILVLYLLVPGLTFEERIFYGFDLGVILISIACFVSAIVFGFNLLQVCLTSLCLLIVSFVLTFGLRSQVAARIKNELQDFRSRLKLRETVWFAEMLLVIGVFFFHLYYNSWRLYPDGWYAGHSFIWGDLPIHTGLIESFVEIRKFPPPNIYFSGTLLSYPFMADFFSSILIILGWSLGPAFVIPGFLLGICTVAGIYLLALRISRSVFASLLTVVLVLLSGGMGFIVFLVEANRSGNFIHTLLNLPSYYTGLRDYAMTYPNIVLGFFLPQRPFLLALPLGMLMLSLLYRFRLSRRPYDMLLVGLASALLPLVHPHTLVTIGIVSGYLVVEYLVLSFLCNDKQGCYRALLSGVLFSLPVTVGMLQVLWQLGNLGATSNGGLSVQITTRAIATENYIWYWLKNVGLFLPLAGLIFVVQGALPNRIRSFYAPFALIWFIATLVVMQPFDCCNRKLLVYWYLVSAVVISLVLVKLILTGDIISRFLVAFLIFLLVFTGSLDLFRASIPSQSRYLEFSNEDIAFANQVKERLPADAVYITATQVHHPITDLAGRQVVLGPPYLANDWGLPWRPRMEDLQLIYTGSSRAQDLIRKYGARYLVIGPTERQLFRVNKQYYQERFPVVLRYGQYTVFDVSSVYGSR